MEQKVYDLSQKLGTTQGQVNTLFQILKDMKDSVKEMAGDIKSIQQDIHKIVTIEEKLEVIKGLKSELKEIKEEVDELSKWKWVIAGGIVILSIFSPQINLVIQRLWH